MKKKQQIKVAAFQMDCELGNVRANLEKIAKLAGSVKKSKPDVICFPELATTGYSLGARWEKYADSIPGPVTDQLSAIAIESDAYLICGVDELESKTGEIFDSAVLISPEGRLAGKYRKVHLWGDERNHFSKGNEFPVFDTEIGKLGIGICYDLEFPESARLLALRGAQVIFFPSAEMSPFESYIETFVRSRSLENRVFVIFSNRIGVEGKTRFFGRSQIISPRCEVLAKAARTTNVAMAKLDLSVLSELKSQFPYLEERETRAYVGLARPAKH